VPKHLIRHTTTVTAEEAMVEGQRGWFEIRLVGSVVLLVASTLAAILMWIANVNCCDTSGDRAFIHAEVLMACGGLVAAGALFAAVLVGRDRMAVGLTAVATLIYVGWGVSLLVTGSNLAGA
jgi:hypothetical protein